MEIYVSIYGGVLSLFVKLSRSKNIEFVKFHTYILEKKIRKIWKNENLREKNVKKLEKALR